MLNWMKRFSIITMLAAASLVGVTFGIGAVFTPGEAHDVEREERGTYLGVALQPLTDELKQSYGYDRNDGVVITGVEDGGPADEAGIRRGDILIRYDGQLVSSHEDLTDRLRDGEPGSTANVTVWRDGRERTFRVTLGEKRTWRGGGRWEWHGDGDVDPDWDGDWDFVMPDLSHLGKNLEILTTHRGYLGVRTENLNPQLAEYFDVSGGEGVLVLEVLEDTPAERAGLRAGDVILSVGDEPVKDREDLIDALREAGEGPATVTVMRRGNRQSLTAELETLEPRVYSYNGPGRYRIRIPHAPHKYRYHIDSDDMEELREDLREMQQELQEMQRELREEFRGDTPE